MIRGNENENNIPRKTKRKTGRNGNKCEEIETTKGDEGYRRRMEDTGCA